MFVVCRVRDFEVIEAFPFGNEFQWEKDGERTSSTLFERNGPIPSAKMLTFFRSVLQCSYSNQCTWNIKISDSSVQFRTAVVQAACLSQNTRLTLMHACATDMLPGVPCMCVADGLPPIEFYI